MQEHVKLKFKKVPGIFSSYARLIFLYRKGLKKGEELPEISAELSNIKIDVSKINRYNDICGLQRSEIIPILYPHVLASPLYMRILTHRRFPIHLIGALHLRNHIIQYRPINIHETLDMKVDLCAQRIVKQGLEFDFTIVVTSQGQKVWESITTWLKRGRFGKDYKESSNADLLKPIPKAKHFIDLYIPNKIGKKYAAITGDYNLIHMSKLLAPLFGLKRDVAHAMWACANALANLPVTIDKKPTRIDFAFKGPLFLDNKSSIKIEKNRNGFRFDLYCGDNPRPSINGNIVTVKHGTSLF